MIAEKHQSIAISTLVAGVFFDDDSACSPATH
jgi:hypothetical protein